VEIAPHYYKNDEVEDKGLRKMPKGAASAGSFQASGSGTGPPKAGKMRADMPQGAADRG